MSIYGQSTTDAGQTTTDAVAVDPCNGKQNRAVCPGGFCVDKVGGGVKKIFDNQILLY